MKRKNIYKIGIAVSIFLAVLPLFALISVNIVTAYMECNPVVNLEIECHGGALLQTLFILSWYWVVTLPAGVFFFCIFYFFAYIGDKKVF